MDQTSRSGNIAELPLCPLLVGFSDSPKVYAPIRVVETEPALRPTRERARPGPKPRSGPVVLRPGTVAARVFDAFAGQHVRTADVMRLLGTTAKAAHNALGYLRLVGLASSVRYGIWAVGVANEASRNGV